MSSYIFQERKGIHIIDLNKTAGKLEEAAAAAKQIAKSGKKILFVATKKQAKDMVKEQALSVGMPFVTERWLGGMLTNFSTIRKSIKKMQSIDKMLQDGTLDNVTKKERLVLTRERDKMNRVIGGIAGLTRVPAAIFMVDISHEHIALAEAKKLGINTLAMVDTNSDPTLVNYPIPSNDDASKSIKLVTQYITDAVKEGLGERQQEKQTRDENAAAQKVQKAADERAKAEAAKTEAAKKAEAKVETAEPVASSDAEKAE